MTLVERITADMKAAMKAGDRARLSAIRMLRAAIKDREIELGHALSDEEAFALMARLVKQRREAARQYQGAGRDELAARENAEAEIYQAYLPAQLADDELMPLVDRAIADMGAAGMRDMGRVMAALRPKVQGRADMGRLSAMVKARLSAG